MAEDRILKPTPLPGRLLRERKDQKWERQFAPPQEESDDRINNAIKWVEQTLAEIFVMQGLGAEESQDKGDSFMDRVDEMYNSIRDGFTRQELIRMLLIACKESALDTAEKIQGDFEFEMDNIIGPQA